MSGRSFEYSFTKVAVGELEVEDLGNCVIEANDDIGNFYYLKIDTNMGWSKIFEYGPANPDFYELPKSVFCSFNRIEYDEGKLVKKISEFLNSPKRNITQAQEIDDDTLFNNIKDIIEYMKNKDNF